jgi:protein-S-isoprenylcysteine O-methyltransferase Ste14
MGYLLLSGLVLNLIGLILIAMSFGSMSQTPQMDERGRTTYSASFLYPRLFQWGIILLIIGFSHTDTGRGRDPVLSRALVHVTADRSASLGDTGMYAWVRHPMYFGALPFAASGAGP